MALSWGFPGKISIGWNRNKYFKSCLWHILEDLDNGGGDGKPLGPVHCSRQLVALRVAGGDNFCVNLRVIGFENLREFSFFWISDVTDESFRMLHLGGRLLCYVFVLSNFLQWMKKLEDQLTLEVGCCCRRRRRGSCCSAFAEMGTWKWEQRNGNLEMGALK